MCPLVRPNTNSGTSKKRCNNRKAGDGYWKETSKKQDVEDEDTGEIIGTKRIFAFYEGNQRNARQTDLALHEYHLSQAVADESIPDPVMSSFLFSFRFLEFTLLILFPLSIHGDGIFPLSHKEEEAEEEGWP